MRIAKINTRLRPFFHQWVLITRPLHKLSKSQQKVLGELLYYHYILSKGEDTSALTLLLDTSIRIKIAKQLGINRSSINNVISALRKLKIIKDNRINNAYIPDIDEEEMSFTIAYKFIIDDEGSRDSETKSNKEIQTNS